MILQLPDLFKVCVRLRAPLSAIKTVRALHSLRYTRPVQRYSGVPIMASLAQQTFFLDEFAQKQFNDSNLDYSGTRIHYEPAEFVKRVQQYHQEGRQLVDGYAPFCKHVFVPNFTGAKLGSLAVTQENMHLLRSGYSRRRPEELPVLSRHAPRLALRHHCRLASPGRLIALNQVVSIAGCPPCRRGKVSRLHTLLP